MFNKQSPRRPVAALVTKVRTLLKNAGAELRAIAGDTLLFRGGRAVAVAVRSQRGGVFGIPDQLIGMLIGVALLSGAVASVTIPKAWSATTKCADQLSEIDLGVREKVTSDGIVPGNGGTITIDDASLVPYLPAASQGGYVDDAAPAGSKYSVTDQSDATNNVARWLIKCPGVHMGITLLRFRNGSLTKHQIEWDSELKLQAA